MWPSRYLAFKKWTYWFLLMFVCLRGAHHSMHSGRGYAPQYILGQGWVCGYRADTSMPSVMTTQVFLVLVSLFHLTLSIERWKGSPKSLPLWTSHKHSQQLNLISMIFKFYMNKDDNKTLLIDTQIKLLFS